MSLDKITGKGITYPIVLVGGKPPIESGTDLIESSLSVLFNWDIPKVLHPEFGVKLNTLLSEPLDVILVVLLKQLCLDAIIMFEPRISVSPESITVSPTQNINELSVIVDYSINNTLVKGTFTFPFNKNKSY